MEKVYGITGNLGADAVLEASGNPTALEQSLKLCRKDGQVCLVGATLESSTISSSLIVGKSLRVTGSFDYTWLTYERAIDLISSGKVHADRIVSNKLPLEQIELAFQLVLAKEAVKVLMVP
ncbi:MAG: zinc-binding dehydrogenase [Nitrososphaerota archaeon]|nr:zinc-binding dehydrogenase [Nitrososphaerota archaeon]